MKKNIPIYLLLLSICITGIGAVFKIMEYRSWSEILLWTGMILFLVSLVWLMYILFYRKQTN